LHIFKNKTTLAHLALLGANLFYGLGFNIAKSVMPALIQPRAFIILRVGITAILFWLSFFMGPNFRTKIDKQDWGRLILCALLGITINQILFFSGLSLTSPIHASLMMLSTPILVTIIATFLIGEKLTIFKIGGLALGVAGALILILARNIEGTGSNIMLGDIFIFLNAASYAFYLVLVKPLMHKYRPIIVIRWIFLIGFIFVLPLGWHQFMEINYNILEAKHWYAIIFIIVGVTFCTYLWNIYAINIVGSSIAGAYIYLQPLFAAIVAIIVMHENITWQKIIACVLIFCGVWVVNRKKRIENKNEDSN
jgi:drug/metabolite transporter (DMT)-like permease